MPSSLIIVVARFFPDSYGGAERQAQILAEALGKIGIDVTIVAPTLDASVPAIEETCFGRIERFKVKSPPSDGGRRILSFFAWTLWFRRRFSKQEYSGVPIYVFHARLHALGPALAARRSGSPLIVKLGGGGESFDFLALQSKRFFYGRWVQKVILRQVNLFVANGVQIVDDLVELEVPLRKIAVFPNGVVLPELEVVEAAMRERPGSRFIYTGRIHLDKRVHVLCEATRSLRSKEKEISLVLLGDGPARQELDIAFGAGSALSGITFPGYVSEIYPHVLAADFFVSASLREGQSNALLEAMSVGVIPIVCAASGVADVVIDGVTGFIVPTSESEAFETAMLRALALSDDERFAMSRAARAFAERNVGIDAIARKTLVHLNALSTVEHGETKLTLDSRNDVVSLPQEQAVQISKPHGGGVE